MLWLKRRPEVLEECPCNTVIHITCKPSSTFFPRWSSTVSQGSSVWKVKIPGLLEDFERVSQLILIPGVQNNPIHHWFEWGHKGVRIWMGFWPKPLLNGPSANGLIYIHVYTFTCIHRYKHVYTHMGFPDGTSGKELACQCRRCKRHWFNLWVGKIPWRMPWQPSPVFLPGESCGQRSMVGYNP